MNIEEKDRSFSILKYEADKNYSREVVKIAQGQNLKMGSVVGQITANGKYKEVSITENETDGSDSAVGVVLQDVDATEASKEGLIVARDAIVIESKIIYPEEATAEQKKKILSDLEKRGIVVRQGV